MMFHAGFALLGLVVPLVFLGVIVLVVWALTHASRHPAPYPPPPPGQLRETPMDILQRRFASGEINAEEYEKARDLLKGDPPSS